MKKFAKRLTALVLTLALVAGMTGQTAFASVALGSELVGQTVELAEGVTVTTNRLWSASKSDLRTENYITYTPGSGVVPVVYSGTYVASRNTIKTAAATLEAQGYRVIAGINGTFFRSDGTVVGMLMTDGVVRSLDVENYALLGITWDGQVFIDESGRTMTKTVSWEGPDGSVLYPLSGFNTYRNSIALGGLYLYNQDFASKVGYDSSRGCVAVVLTPAFDEEEPGEDPQPPEASGGEIAEGPQPPEASGGEIAEGPQPPEASGGEIAEGPQSPEASGGEIAEGPQPPEASGGEIAEGPQPPEASGGEIADDPQPPEPGEEEPGEDPQPPEPNKNVVMNGTLTLSVETIMDTRAGDAFNGVLPDGRYMLYVNYYDGNDALVDALRSLTPGQRVSVTVSGVSEQWADAAYGVSGLYSLLRNGAIVSGLPTASNPYTAVGIKADGTAVFYTIDGRQSGYSIGATYAQVAQRLQELGCVSAVAMDGGGSTSLGATLPGQQKFQLVNHPSQSGRSLNNTIFLVTGDGYDGMEPGFYLSSDTQVVFAGASLDVHALRYDKWGQEIPWTPPVEPETPPTGPEASPGGLETPPAEPEMLPDWSATGGTIEGNGLTAVYTAGSTAGTYTVSSGSGFGLPIRVVNELSQLMVTGEKGAQVNSLSLQAWDTVDLSASGRWRNLDVAIGDENVTWAVSGDIGTIDAQGRFTAGSTAASGKITASAGGKTVTINVTVEKNFPFSDIEEHWSADYVIWLYKLGLTKGIELSDGTYVFLPSSDLTRGELLTFITRLLQVDTAEYLEVELPFADVDTIPDWMLPAVKAMYALGVLNGSNDDGTLYANVNSSVRREEAMTMLGRVLADQVSQDLSDFADNDLVSDWALSYVETLVGLNVVQGSDGMLAPQSDITRGEAAKLLVEVNDLEKAELSPRPSDPGTDEPGDDPSDTPDDPSDTPDDPSDTPDDPSDTPDDPGDTPDDPSDTPDDPGDTPDDPNDTPDDPSDTPDDPSDTPDDPSDTPDAPGDTTDASGDTTDEPEQPGEGAGGPVSSD